MEPRILRLREVQQQTRLSKATIYRLLRSGAFPRPIRLSERAVGWRTEEIDEWLASRERAGGFLSLRLRVKPLATVADWLAVLEVVGWRGRRSGVEWSGPCPVCGGNDRFHVRPGRKVLVLVGCRNGCSFEQLRDAVFGSPQRAAWQFRSARRQPPSARGRTHPMRLISRASAKTPSTRASGGADASGAVAKWLWTKAEPADRSLARSYLARRLAWPPHGIGPCLPRNVRWLPMEATRGCNRPAGFYGLPRGAAGAILFAYRHPGGGDSPGAVSAEALDGAARWLSQRWRRTFGSRAGLVFEAATGPGAVRVVEGEVSAIAARWLHAGETIRAVGGTTGMVSAAVQDLDPQQLVVIESDGDPQGRAAAGRMERQLIEASRPVRVEDRPGQGGADAADDLAELVTEALAMTDGNPAAAWARICPGQVKR